MTEGQAQRDYFFASDAERDRLQLQAQVWEPETEALLDRIGVRPGWSCLEVGCGAMGVLGPLSRRVGPNGRVVGLEPDASYIAAAGAFRREAKLENVELLQRSLDDHGLPQDAFDLVHERFVLPHVGAPQQMLERMIALTKPGGIIVVQEGDHSSWNFHPPAKGWARFVRVIEDTVALKSDINIGRRTYALLRGLGLEGVSVRAAVLALPSRHPYMRMPIAAVEAMRPRIVAAKLSTDAELAELLRGVEECAGDPEAFQITFTVTQVWGRKPAAC